MVPNCQAQYGRRRSRSARVVHELESGSCGTGTAPPIWVINDPMYVAVSGPPSLSQLSLDARPWGSDNFSYRYHRTPGASIAILWSNPRGMVRPSGTVGELRGFVQRLLLSAIRRQLFKTARAEHISRLVIGRCEMVGWQNFCRARPTPQLESCTS